MGIHDRPYMRSDYRPPGGGGITHGMPRPGKAVGWLLAINIAVFVAGIFLGRRLLQVFAVIADSEHLWQVWRYITFQFLHASGWHLFFNMIGLYFLGMYLERAWGTKRFLRFYLICGLCGGVAHVLLSQAFGVDLFVPLLGASGGVYGLVLACAILFPHIRVILFLFPVPIRFAAAIFLGIAGISVLMGIRSAMAGGALGGGISHIAHLGGAAAAAVWIWAIPNLRGAKQQARAKLNRGAWEKKMKKRADKEAEIDRILTKIHDEGIGSLTSKEKKILQQTTKRQQEQERDFYRP